MKITANTEKTFAEAVQEFYVDPESENLNDLQRDGATALIDLATDFENHEISNDIDLMAHVLGRLSDIQVRDFAMGSHNESTFPIYFRMWAHLLEIAPTRFIAPVACLHAALAYELASTELAIGSLARARADDPSYSLAILLQRTFSSNWPPSAFAAMRKELHPKVSAGIFE